jgi:hypothetical protein
MDPPVGSVVGKKLLPLAVLPVRVSGNVAPPATAVIGLIELSTGTGFAGGLMTNEMVLDSPLFPAPDAGLIVLTVAIPGVATSAAGTVAVTTFPNTFPALSVGTTVLRFFPFHCTSVCATNVPPLTVNMKSALPALCTIGERDMIVAPVLF